MPVIRGAIVSEMIVIIMPVIVVVVMIMVMIVIRGIAPFVWAHK